LLVSSDCRLLSLPPVWCTPFLSGSLQFKSIGHQFATSASSSTKRIIGSVPMNELLETPPYHGTTAVASLETMSQAMDTCLYLYCTRHVTISTKATIVATETDTAQCIQSQSTSVGCGTPINKALDQLHKDDETNASLFIMTLSVGSTIAPPQSTLRCRGEASYKLVGANAPPKIRKTVVLSKILPYMHHVYHKSMHPKGKCTTSNLL